MALGRFSEGIKHHLAGDYIKETIDAASTLAEQVWKERRGLRRFTGVVGEFSRELSDLRMVPIVIVDRASKAIRRRS